MVQGVLRAVGVDNPVQVQMGHRIVPNSAVPAAGAQPSPGDAQAGILHHMCFQILQKIRMRQSAIQY